jgi:exodeoxyribonuclease V gamma subunit
MLFLHRNNRMEFLLEELGDVLSTKRPQVFRPEVIVVQSLGMERWLSMGLSRRFGVWANAEHPFPRALIEQVLETIIGPVPPERRWSRESMTFHLTSIFDALPEEPSLARLRGYLLIRDDIESRLELAAEIADAFDQAQIYRPEWFLAWASRSKNLDAHDFRPSLFRLLEQRLGSHHFPVRVESLLARLPGVDCSSLELPSRICLFAVAAMPPTFLRVFDALSTKLPVHWFLLTASREYLGEEMERRELARLPSKGQSLTRERVRMQPLLGSYGRMMRDLGQLVERDCVYEDAGQKDFVESRDGTVLSTLQADLCVLGRRGTGGELPALPLRPGDDSVQVHVCHGPRRELEVLKEVLLQAFEREPDLVPEDVIVLLRDVEVYAPLVQAVFSTERGKPGYVPYTLADRAIGTGNAVADALKRYLDCISLRINIADLEDLLEYDALLRKFDIEPLSVTKIRDWLSVLGARWGADVAERKREGLPEQPEHTLRFALSRLVLGAAMDSSAESAFLGMLPFDVEGDDAILAGRFVNCVTTLLDFRERFAVSRTFAQWDECLLEVVEALFSVPPELSWQLSEVRAAVQATCADAVVAGFDSPVPIRVVITRLAEHFENTRSSRAFLSGGVTFCAMLPMRGIPAKIVVMLGLDDGSFPRVARVSSFDEIAREPQVGDRLLREEDRHLFLESLLAARQRFIITYTGRSARDDSPRPPSVVIEELLGVIDESFFVADGGNPSDTSSEHASDRASYRLVVVHPMHAHSPRYFDGSDARLLQSSPSAFRAAQALVASRFEPPVGLRQRLTASTKTQLRIAEFERFWEAPGDAFWQSRLLARTDRELKPIEVLEPVELDGLSRWSLMNEQFVAARERKATGEQYVLWKANGRSPAGALGMVAFEQSLERILPLRNCFAQLTQGKSERFCAIALVIGGVTLTGYVGELYGQQRLDWGVSALRPKNRLRAWLRHLLLAASGNAVRSYVLRPAAGNTKRPSLERWCPLSKADALQHLERLLELYVFGTTAPLPFFPALSYEFVLRQRKGESKTAALAKATRSYVDALEDGDGGFVTPEMCAEVARLYGEQPPLADDWPERQGLEGLPCFSALSAAVYGPCLDALEALSPDEEELLRRCTRGSAVIAEDRP